MPKKKDEQEQQPQRYYGGVDYYGDGGRGQERQALDNLETAIYHARSRDNLKAERERIRKAREATERKNKERREALERQRDEEAERNAEQLKEKLRKKYLATGVMMGERFEKEWPRILREFTEERVREQQRELEQSVNTNSFRVL